MSKKILVVSQRFWPENNQINDRQTAIAQKNNMDNKKTNTAQKGNMDSTWTNTAQKDAVSHAEDRDHHTEIHREESSKRRASSFEKQTIQKRARSLSILKRAEAFEASFQKVGRHFAVPAVLLKAIARQESGCNPLVINIQGKDYHPRTRDEALFVIRCAEKNNKSIIQIG